MNRLLAFVFACLSVCFGVCAQTPVRLLHHVADTAACHRWVEAQLERMTLKQKIGQLFIHTVEPSLWQRNKDNVKRAVTEYGIGGLLFSSGEVDKQVALTNLAQQWANVPLLVTFDGEWGLSMRLKGTPEFPRNRVLGCIQDDSLIYRYGREVARELREIGVHVNFAPVADVDNNPDNPVINTRSFGGNPREVARKVTAYARGLEDGGVMAVCKHFPGHGDTDTDSHHALPVLPFSRARLDSIELYPFKQAVEAGVGGMMVGHLHVPELGDKPASISPRTIGELLKGELGFSGLVFTDALEMKGITNHADEVCVQALLAGNDLLLVPRNLKKSLTSVLQAVKSGKLTEEDITARCRKVLTYKYALGLQRRPEVIKTDVQGRICLPETDRLTDELEKAAVVVAKDSADMLPLNASLSGSVLLSLSPTLAEAYPFYNRLKETVPVAWVHANVDSLAQIRERIRPAQQVIAAIYQPDCTAWLPLLEELAMDKPLAVVCFSSQRALEKMPVLLEKASAVVLAHTGKQGIQEFVAEVMAGRTCADGRLSVGVAGLGREGIGLTLDPEHPRSYTPEDFGMDSHVLARIDTIAREGIREHAFPGCHVLVWKDGYPVYNKHFGRQTYDDGPELKENDLYDLASLSKMVGTMLAVMKLYDEGKFGLTDRVSRYVSALRGTNKQHITVQDLLFHESGLPAYLPFYEEAIDLKSCKGGLFRKKPDATHRVQVAENLYACTRFSYKEEWVQADSSARFPLPMAEGLYLNPDFRKEIMKQIIKAPLKGRAYRYSCLNFMLLQEMVETLAGVPMDVYLDSVFYKPIGLQHTAYNPLRRFKRNQVIPTVAEDFLRNGEVRGYVHDEAAAFMGGVSGNAGLFSTAHDVAVLCQMLLDKGVCADHRYLTRATCELFMTMKSHNSRRGLGFDKPDTDHPASSPCTSEAPASVFGHTGFTGTCAWVDPENGLVFVFLSNRTYPRPFSQKKLMELNIRPRMQQAMYQSLMK